MSAQGPPPLGFIRLLGPARFAPYLLVRIESIHAIYPGTGANKTALIVGSGEEGSEIHTEQTLEQIEELISDAQKLERGQL